MLHSKQALLSFILFLLMDCRVMQTILRRGKFVLRSTESCLRDNAMLGCLNRLILLKCNKHVPKHCRLCCIPLRYEERASPSVKLLSIL